jgi:hypothetical protein
VTNSSTEAGLESGNGRRLEGNCPSAGNRISSSQAANPPTPSGSFPYVLSIARSPHGLPDPTDVESIRLWAAREVGSGLQGESPDPAKTAPGKVDSSNLSPYSEFRHPLPGGGMAEVIGTKVVLSTPQMKGTWLAVEQPSDKPRSVHREMGEALTAGDLPRLKARVAAGKAVYVRNETVAVIAGRDQMFTSLVTIDAEPYRGKTFRVRRHFLRYATPTEIAGPVLPPTGPLEPEIWRPGPPDTTIRKHSRVELASEMAVLAVKLDVWRRYRDHPEDITEFTGGVTIAKRPMTVVVIEVKEDAYLVIPESGQFSGSTCWIAKDAVKFVPKPARAVTPPVNPEPPDPMK